MYTTYVGRETLTVHIDAKRVIYISGVIYFAASVRLLKLQVKKPTLQY